MLSMNDRQPGLRSACFSGRSTRERFLPSPKGGLLAAPERR